jgi:predicted AlkP superfamily phosphohydrolase/phosphomutase
VGGVEEKGKIRMKVYYLPHVKYLCVEGETFKVKDELKKRGFTWNSTYKRWVKKDVVREQLPEVVKELKALGEVWVSPLDEALDCLDYALLSLRNIAKQLDTVNIAPNVFRDPAKLDEYEKKAKEYSDKVLKAWEQIARATDWLQKNRDEIEFLLMVVGANFL